MKIVICILLLIGAILSVYDAVVLQKSDDDIDINEIEGRK